MSLPLILYEDAVVDLPSLSVYCTWRYLSQGSSEGGDGRRLG